MVGPFPIYILPVNDDFEVWAPPGRRDITHHELWEQYIVCWICNYLDEHGDFEEKISKLPYSLHHARVEGDNVHFGEDPNPKILAAIRRVFGKPKLEFAHDLKTKRDPAQTRQFDELVEIVYRKQLAEGRRLTEE